MRGNLAALFTEYYEEGFIKDYSIRFRGMVFLDDVITLKSNAERRRYGTACFSGRGG